MNTNNSLTSNNKKLVKCLQINLQHSKLATANFAQLLIDLEIDVALIQEPYVRKDPQTNQLNIPDIPGEFSTFHHLSYDQHQYGAAVIIKTNLNPSVSETMVENHAIGVNIPISNSVINFFSVHCKPKTIY